MKIAKITIGLIVCFNYAMPNNYTDSLLIELDKVIQNQEEYQNKKIERINAIKNFFLISKKENELSKQYNVADLLYEEYKTFNYDSAVFYGYQLLEAASQLNNPVNIADAKIKLSLLLLSAGMFTETINTLNTISPTDLNDSLKTTYYRLFARTYFDMADYANDIHFLAIHNMEGYTYIDSALLFASKNSYDYYSINGLRFLRMGDVDSARFYYESLINDFNLSSRQYAIEASSLSFIYFYSDKQEESMQLLIKSAIEDVKYSIKETTAIRNLADMLYKQGDNDRAYSYIQGALDDADFYGANQRKIQISNILPIIEQKQIEIIKHQKSKLLKYSIILLVISVSLFLLVVIVYIQKGRLKFTKLQLAKTNGNLNRFVEKLTEANQIKEEYIGQFFKTITAYIAKIEGFKKSVNRKMTVKRFDEIGEIINKINVKKEREELFQSFDTIFLRIFPDFIDNYNKHLKRGEDPISLENSGLSSEMRIFALIRLGNFSVNTIYTYKTRIKNKLDFTNEEFEKQIKVL
jgi:hypothetical protein